MKQMKNQRYHFGEVLGKGGFATVYAAQLPNIPRKLAIKVLDLQALRAQNLHVEDEINFMRRLKHPHIVPLLDAWQDEANAYLVMPRLGGGSLSQRLIMQDYFNPVAAANILMQIAQALSYVHAQAIIHQDLKPANILIDEQGKAYLTDFGIAYDLAANLPKLRRDGLVGSPRYISPEQLRREQTSYRSDIYSLGLLLYEMLTGVPPYQATELDVLCQEQLFRPVPSLQTIMPHLSNALNAPIIRATQKNPSDRYDSALDFAEDFYQIAQSYQNYAEA